MIDNDQRLLDSTASLRDNDQVFLAISERLIDNDQRLLDISNRFRDSDQALRDIAKAFRDIAKAFCGLPKRLCRVTKGPCPTEAEQSGKEEDLLVTTPRSRNFSFPCSLLARAGMCQNASNAHGKMYEVPLPASTACGSRGCCRVI